MATRKYHKKPNKRFRKTRSKRQRGGTINNNIKLIRSSMFGHRKAVRKLLEQDGIDVNAKNSDGYTALILASSNGRTEIVAMLLDAGANVNARTNTNYWGSTALIRASENKHTEIVAMLLDNGADVNATDDDGDTALMRVINCNAEDDRPWYQVEYDIIEIVEMLLTAGADVNVVNNNKTALDIAEETSCTKQIQLLLKQHNIKQIIPKHLEIQEQRRKDRKNLHMVMSAKRIHPDLERYTSYNLGGKRKTHKHHHKKKHGRKTRSKKQKGGMSQYERDKRDNELIELSNYYDQDRRYPIVKLLEEGVSRSAKNMALRIASRDGEVGLVTLLFLYDGVNVNDKDISSRTALFWASNQGHTEIVEILLEKGADVNEKDYDDYTALISASEKGHTEVVRMLLEKGADVNAKTNDGDTALIQASYYGHTEIVKLLKQYIVAQTFPRHLERQQNRLQVGRVMDSKKMPGDLTHKIITEHFGGKRKTRKAKKSRRSKKH